MGESEKIRKKHRAIGQMDLAKLKADSNAVTRNRGTGDGYLGDVTRDVHGDAELQMAALEAEVTQDNEGEDAQITGTVHFAYTDAVADDTEKQEAAEEGWELYHRNHKNNTWEEANRQVPTGIEGETEMVQLNATAKDPDNLYRTAPEHLDLTASNVTANSILPRLPEGYAIHLWTDHPEGSGTCYRTTGRGSQDGGT